MEAPLVTLLPRRFVSLHTQHHLLPAFVSSFYRHRKQSVHYHLPPRFYYKTWRDDLFLFFSLSDTDLCSQPVNSWCLSALSGQEEEMEPSETYFSVKPGRIGSDCSWIKSSDQEKTFCFLEIRYEAWIQKQQVQYLMLCVWKTAEPGGLLVKTK